MNQLRNKNKTIRLTNREYDYIYSQLDTYQNSNKVTNWFWKASQDFRVKNTIDAMRICYGEIKMSGGGTSGFYARQYLQALRELISYLKKNNTTKNHTPLT